MTEETKKRISAINSGTIPEGYKKTKVGIVPVEWEIKPIKKLCDISSGNTPSRNNTNNFNGNNIWLSSGELKSKYVYDSNEKISNQAMNALKIYSKGTVVIAIYGLEAVGVRGSCSILAVPCTISQACMAFENFKNMINEYFYYWYQYNGEIIGLKYAQGTKQQNLSNDIVEKINVIIPPLHEQQKIAEILSTQDKLIELQERKIEQLKTLKKGYLQKMFPKKGCKYPELRFKGFTDPWEQCELSNVADFSKGYGYSKNDLKEIGTPIILYGRLYTKYETVISEVDTFVDAQPNSVYSTGQEVIVPASGETAEDISRASFVDSKGILLGGDLNIIKPTAFINPVFLALTISNGNQQKEISKRAQGKSVVHIHNADLEKVVLSYPESEEQKRIGALFIKLDRLITLHQRKLDKEKQKKKALMQLLLTGKVRVST